MLSVRVDDERDSEDAVVLVPAGAWVFTDALLEGACAALAVAGLAGDTERAVVVLLDVAVMCVMALELWFENTHDEMKDVSSVIKAPQTRLLWTTIAALRYLRLAMGLQPHQWWGG